MQNYLLFSLLGLTPKNPSASIALTVGVLAATRVVQS